VKGRKEGKGGGGRTVRVIRSVGSVDDVCEIWKKAFYVNQVGWYISGTYMALGLSGVCFEKSFLLFIFFPHLLGRIFLLAYLYTVAVKLIIFFRAISCPLFLSHLRFF